MKLDNKIGALPKNNNHISFAVRYKFFFLLFFTLALMFDVMFRSPKSNLFNNRHLPKMIEQGE